MKEIILAKNVSYNKLLELEATTDGLTKLNNHTALFNYLHFHLMCDKLLSSTIIRPPLIFSFCSWCCIFYYIKGGLFF